MRDVIASFLTPTLQPAWTLFEETRMTKTGVVLRCTSLADVDQLGRRKPDWILVSEVHKEIAIVDLSHPSDVYQAQLLGSHKEAADISPSGGRPELLHLARLGGA